MSKDKIKFLGKAFYWWALFVLLIIAGLTIISGLDIPGNYKLLTVQSGSMEPAIKQGSVVVVKPADEYHKGDVITFVDLNNPKDSVTHRVFEVQEDTGRITFITKGDANDAPDTEKVLKGQVLGRMLFNIPFLGYPVSFAKTKEGLVLLVIVPAVIIIYSELLNIKKELAKINFQKRIKKYQKKIKRWLKKAKRFMEQREKVIKRLLPKITILAFILSLPLIEITNAYVSDEESSSENTFSTETLDFSLTSSEDFSPLTLIPGELATRSLSVVKDGSLDFQYNIQAVKTSGDDGFCNALQVEAQLDGVPQYTGSLMSLNLAPSVVISDEQDNWQFILSFTDNNPDLQNQTCSFDFIFEGSQLDSSGFSDQEKVSNTIQSGYWEVKINEVYYDTVGIDSKEEWIELYNAGSGTVDLSGWKLTDLEGTFVIPPGTVINPDNFLVIARNQTGFFDLYDFNPDISGLNLALHNGKDEVILRTPGDIDIDAVVYEGGSYGGITPHPGVATGHSIARSPKGADTEDCSVDFVDNPSPNPGTNPHSYLQTDLDFYLRADKKAVGFSITGILPFENLDYEIIYEADEGMQGIVGSLTIPEGEDEIIQNDLLLGTCSSLGQVCVYHTGIEVINLTVTLTGPGIPDRILEETLELED